MTSNRSVTYTCALCDSQKRVRWYCNDCQDNLCDRCKEVHTHRKKTKNDHIVATGEANRQGDKHVPDICNVHPCKLCDVYCCDCDVLMCLTCFSQTHKQHNMKHFEDEFSTKKQLLQEHMTAITAKIEHFKNKTSTRHRANTTFKDNVDTIRKEVNQQRTKLKREVDDIADVLLDEIRTLEKEDVTMREKDCQRSEKKVEELTRLLVKAKTTDTSSISIFEKERLLRTILPLYDVHVKGVLPKQAGFVTGSIDRVMLMRMLGELHFKSQYEKTIIDSKHVQHISKFTVIHDEILSMCPVDDSHAWLSVYQYKGLVLVNRECMVTERVTLDFCPLRIAMVGTTDILMTRDSHSTFVYKLSLHTKQVIAFSNINPHKAWGISINKRGHVFVSTTTPEIVVLNRSGTIVRKVTCGMTVCVIACLSSGDVAVSDYDNVSIVADQSGSTKYKSTGELDNGQKVASLDIRNMSCDKHDRLFVSDISNTQVYVLSNDTQATCLLDQKHGGIDPTAVGVDTCGNVWIGCGDGIVHVMRL